MIDVAAPFATDAAPWARPRHPVTTLGDLVAAAVRKHAPGIAIVAQDRPALSFADLGQRIEAIVGQLEAAGYRGARIGMALPDTPDSVIAMLGVCAAATCAPLNDKLDEDALAQLLLAMRIDALIVPDGENSASVRAARRCAVAPIAVRPAPTNELGAFALHVQSRREGKSGEPPRAQDVALLMHTSGTTSAPKIVPWKQWQVAETVRNRIELSRIDETDRCLIALPLHSSAAIRRVLAGLTAGASILCPGPVSADDMIDLLDALSPTQYFAAPTSHIALLDAFERRRPRPRHCLRVIWSGTTELPRAIRHRLEEAFAVPVINGYGTTEAGGITQTPFPPDMAPAESIGRATNVEIAVADAGGRFVGPDESGEILVRGPEVFEGYENNAEANRAAFRDGWFRTGDAGRVDRDGFVYLEGRLTDLINRGGQKVVPGEIEAALLDHPQVIEAAAFAVPHRTLGQDVAAAVVVRARSSERELRRFLRSKLAAFKIPSRIVEAEALPRGPGGKIDRAVLARCVDAAAPLTVAPLTGDDAIAIARIFSRVLLTTCQSMNDNFFDLGGDSLRGMRVLADVEREFGVSMTLDTLFDHPTVAEFAAAVHGTVHSGSAAPAGSAIERGA